MAAGANSSSFNFTFTPSAVGPAAGSGTLLTSAGRPKKLELKGNGVYQKKGTTCSVSGGDLVKDKPLDFGNVIVNQTKTLSFSVNNSDPANAITVTPSWKNGGAPFSVPAGNIAVPSKGSTSVTVSFTPPAVQSYTDILEFTDTKDGKNIAGTVVKGSGVKGE